MMKKQLLLLSTAMVALLMFSTELWASEATTAPTLRFTLDSTFVDYHFSDPPLDNFFVNGIVNVFRPTHLFDAFFPPLPALEYRIAKQSYLGLQAGLLGWGGGSAGGDYFFSGVFKAGLNVSQYIRLANQKELWLSLGGGIRVETGYGAEPFRFLEMRSGVNYRVAKNASFGPFLSSTLLRNTYQHQTDWYRYAEPKYKVEIAVGLHSSFDLLH